MRHDDRRVRDPGALPRPGPPAVTSVYEWQLPPMARSVPEARRHVREALHDWQLDGLVDAALLLTSEIVTNSVLHARTTVTVRVTKNGDTGVRIAVTDESPVVPAMRNHSEMATTGRGMQMLDQLADEWGTRTDAGGKTVSFTLSRSRDPWSGYGDEAIEAGA